MKCDTLECIATLMSKCQNSCQIKRSILNFAPKKDQKWTSRNSNIFTDFIFGALGFNYENDRQILPNETFVVIYKHCDADPF